MTSLSCADFPRDMDFEGVSELEIVREGDSIILRPVRPTLGSFA